MMKLINKRVVNELLSHPATLVPVAGGGTWFFASLIFGLGGAFWGAAAIILGGTMAASRYILNYEGLAQKVLDDAEAEKAKEREQILDNLYNKLCQTKEARDENALERLRLIYDTFVDDISKGKYTKVVNTATMKQIDELFHTCVGLLENSYDLWEDASHATNSVKKKIRSDRAIVLDRVDEAIEKFNTMVAQIRSTHISGSAEKLVKASRELQDKIEIAQEVDREMREIQTRISGDLVSE